LPLTKQSNPMDKPSDEAIGVREAPRDGDTEGRILDAAHAVFLRRGTAGARMQEIADEAGVNKALLHYYFRSKDRLAEAVFGRILRGMFPPLISILGSELALEEKVHRFVALELEILSRNPFVPAYLIAEMNQHPDRVPQLVKALAGVELGGVVPQVRGTLQRQLDARAADGTMRPLAAEQFFVNLVSLCIFPFAARPLICAALGMDSARFAAFIEERKTALPEFFLGALRP
jgi:TetR/AcrR family transcriptional regulator